MPAVNESVPTTSDVRVAIIGAGLGGIAVAVNLKRTGTASFTLFERASGPGGVWWHNTYPGCEVDVPSHAYSYSFTSYDWAGTHASQPELQQYVEDVIDTYKLRSHIRFACGVQAVDWDGAAWHLTTDESEVLEFDVVVPCLGMLSDPRQLDLPGLQDFEGPVFHTSRYEHHHDLGDKRVSVIGTGSTACQLVPALAEQVGHLTLYQHEPGHILPKRSRPFTDEERRRFRKHPWRQRIARFQIFYTARKLREALKTGTPESLRIHQRCERFIAKTVEDPEVRSVVTPQYAFGCKRPIFASTFYPALNRDNVELVPHAATAVTPCGIVDAQGSERPADLIVFATGFKTTQYLRRLEVHGEDGASLQDVWAGEPSAFLGMTVPGFPNFFIVYGPNTNGGWSVITQLERQAELIARLARRLRRHPKKVIDTRPAAAQRFDTWVQRGIAKRLSSLQSGCANYYHTATGKNVTQWPHSHTAYLLTTRLGWRLGLYLRPKARRPRQPDETPALASVAAAP
jgi:cation diffusion facilitator CzcD-associated flavoprotein CzcO